MAIVGWVALSSLDEHVLTPPGKYLNLQTLLQAKIDGNSNPYWEKERCAFPLEFYFYGNDILTFFFKESQLISRVYTYQVLGLIMWPDAAFLLASDDTDIKSWKVLINEGKAWLKSMLIVLF